jgi:hypothetical protein
MSIEDLNKAFSSLQNNAELIKSSGKKIDEEVIKKAQDYLEVKFPTTYKKFISKVGFLSLGGCEIYGIIDEDFINSGVPDAIWFSYENRKNYGTPDYLVQIYSVGEGTTYCLDTSQMNEEGECPVVAWPLGGYEETPVLEVIAEDFGKFFLDMVQQQIEYKKELAS